MSEFEVGTMGFWGSRIALAIVFMLMGFVSAQGALFRNSYVSFELPPNWQCQVEETEWVCQALSANQSREAVIILTAKEVGPLDSLPAYNAHLKTPRKLPSGVSKVYFTRQTNINNHPWIDGMHFASELPNYFTRYLATIKDRIAVLVTFSSHKLHYTKYSGQFFKSIMSLRTVASQNLLRGSALNLAPGANEPIGSSAPFIGTPDFDENMPAEEDNHSSGTRSYIFALAIIIAALGIYIFIKNQRD